MDDLLKEAIADAKAVRETALENAKIALEEAFTPRLQSMLSKKIQSEIEDEDMEDEERGMDEMEDEDMEDEERGVEERGMEDEERGMEDEDAHEGMHDEDDDVDEMEDEEDEPSIDIDVTGDKPDISVDDDDEEEEMGEDDVIEINGRKYAPVVSEMEDEDDEGMHDEDEDENLDLEAVIRELEAEIEDEDDDVKEMEDEDEEKNEEVDAATGIGSSDNKAGNADKSSNIGSKDKAKFTEGAHEEDEKEEGMHDENEEEDIDLEEILKALSEEEDEDKEMEEVSKLKSDLDEHRNVVKYLRSKLNEVNLLNAKLLFTNKLFRSHGLTNEQKMKVVETFDRAATLREVKLVYSTLAESFGSKTKTDIKESKGSASKAVASTKSKKQEVIAEGHEMRDRFKKLAGIL
tara:strand:- start:5669 stop:6883 length:1215 start_codon:yes stop_codon:yes gene_type:complete